MNETINRIIRIGLILILFNILFLLSYHTLPIIFRFLHYVYHLFLPFIAAFFLAFLLHTLVDRLEQRGIHRLLAVLFIYLLFFILIAYLVSVIVPTFFAQIQSFTERIPSLYRQLEQWIQFFWRKMPFIPKEYQFSLSELLDFAETQFEQLDIRKLKISTLFDSFSVIVLAPIVSFYFLYDYNNIKRRIKHFLTRHQWRYAYKFIRELDAGLGSYFRGLILVMNLLALVSTLCFMFTGLDYPVFFGFLIGYTNVIPIIGPYLGGIPAVLFALTDSLRMAIIVLVIIVGLQFLESNFVTPYIQSRSIDSHPLMVLIAIVVFGKLFGLIGMIGAIPLLYIILLVLKYVRMILRVKRIQRLKQKIQNIQWD